MSKTTTPSGATKVAKVNVSYLAFISDLIKNNVEVTELNQETVEQKYNEIVNLKFSNIRRVANRNSRKAVIAKRNEYLLKELKIAEKDYDKVNKAVLALATTRTKKYL